VLNKQQKLAAQAWCSAVDDAPGAFALSYVEVVASLDPKTWPAARVEVRHAGSVRSEVATGAGGLDAIFNALNAIVGIDAKLENLDLRYASTGPAKALPQVVAFAVLRIGGKLYKGRADAEDIMLACARAYLCALERCHYLNLERRSKTARPRRSQLSAARQAPPLECRTIG
jgi:hypothetical protein